MRLWSLTTTQLDFLAFLSTIIAFPLLSPAYLLSRLQNPTRRFPASIQRLLRISSSFPARFAAVYPSIYSPLGLFLLVSHDPFMSHHLAGCRWTLTTWLCNIIVVIYRIDCSAGRLSEANGIHRYSTVVDSEMCALSSRCGSLSNSA